MAKPKGKEVDGRMPRELDKKFMEDLTLGMLSSCLDYVKKDRRLQLEIRGNYINIYYRGSNVFKVTANNDDVKRWYNFSFDNNYTDESDPLINVLKKVKKVKDSQGCSTCMSMVPDIINRIDNYHAKNKQKYEKYIQQGIIESSPLDDYVITDFEYQKGNHARFDLFGVKIIGDKSVLSFIELKQGYSSLSTSPSSKTGKLSSGLKKHLEDIINELKTETDKKIEEEIKQVNKLLQQKKELGLVNNDKAINEVVANEIEILFLLANYRNKKKGLSQSLCKEIDKIKTYMKNVNLGIKVMVNFVFLTTNCNYISKNKSKETDIYGCLGLMHEYHSKEINQYPYG